ncbi:hypothetical protein AN639_04645 [Candidatus Epulonipiscium fishelsonii]|uniref:Uncharacterized protein n=1 Tax=Candidatus Epulonipiscium fishelsonii TaxID=77094 RepID=A0ACC8XD48_9FIRM|nr:hypothetical protein AN639_04645 [Epulopiscium sp. SCG-B05WGA-EpuloA1]ONI40769.1 hypothetical protein AN396_04950 [Epulopiscium sp. SCG-B11WGA-EpuloA1]
MIRGLRVVWAMCWHFIITTFSRQKYRLDNKTIDNEETRGQYRAEIYKMTQELCRRMLKAAGTEVVATGIENLPKSGPVVYISNHKSLFDGPVLATLIDDPLVFIGKDEVKKIPIINSWFAGIGGIYIVREDIKQSLEAILKGVDELNKGYSIVIFPEGTRGKNIGLEPFKSGSFKLPIKAKVPIVPIAIQNTPMVYEANGHKIKKAKVYVNIGKVIETTNLTKEETKHLHKQVEDCIRDLLSDITHT